MSGSVLSPATQEALQLLGISVRTGRIRRGWTLVSLAERLGVSKPTVIRIERGDARVAIGTVFEAATLVGVALFDPDPAVRARHAELKRIELALLPSAVRERDVDDDF